MTLKLLQDVAKAFCIGAMWKRERNIENILAFLMNPDESHFRTSGTLND